MLIKAQTDLTQYGMFPGYNFNEGRLSDEEQRYNIDRAVDAIDDAPSLDEIFTGRAYDTGMGRQNLEEAVTGARQQAMSNLLEGQTRDYKDYNQLLDDILDHETASGVTVGSEALPESLRQYYSRQETLPEHAPNMQTENWQMPDGSIRPGAIAPINAVKQMGQPDIESMMQGAGLLPMYNPELKHWDHRNIPSLFQFDFSNEPHEENIPLMNPSHETRVYHRGDTPSTVNRNRLAAWATGANVGDMVNVIQQNNSGNMNMRPPQGFVGIRGLNVKDDNIQVRPSRGNHQERLNEAAIQTRIPPSRLVPIRHREDDITGRQLPSNEGFEYPDKLDIESAFGDNPQNVPSVDYIRSLPLTTYPEQFNDAYDKFGNMITPSGESIESLEGVKPVIQGSTMRRDVTPPSWGVQHERMKDIPPKIMREMARQLQQSIADKGLVGQNEVPPNEFMTFENAERLLPFYEEDE